MKPPFDLVIKKHNLLGVLSDFEPVVIGTPPLGIAVDSSDMDIACAADDLDLYMEFVVESFGHLADFAFRYALIKGEPSVVVTFQASGWAVEVFCQRVPTAQQWGVRHFRVEQRLLALAPELAAKVQDLKRRGLKTEPAFADVLKLSGDPYRAVLDLEGLSDQALAALIAGAVRHN